jgi:hypothetical protein
MSSLTIVSICYSRCQTKPKHYVKEAQVADNFYLPKKTAHSHQDRAGINYLPSKLSQKER